MNHRQRPGSDCFRWPQISTW